MGLGGVAIAVLPSMIYPKQPFSDGLGGVKTDNFYQYPCAFCLCYNKQVINGKQEAWR